MQIVYLIASTLIIGSVYGIDNPEGVDPNGAVECDRRSEMYGSVLVEYCCVNCVKEFQFDMILPGSCCGDPELQRRLSPAKIDSNSYWPNAYIPYEIDSNLADQERIHSAVAHYADTTSIRLGPRQYESDYVRFVWHESGCSSSVGKISAGGAQTINVADWCSTGNVIHEIGHALGLHHTQSREDRELFIEINWDNVPDDWVSAYNQYPTDFDDCLSYDYGSIMHYPSTLLGLPVITTINPANSAIGQRSGLSALDASCLTNLYSHCRVSLFENGDFTGIEYAPFGVGDYDLTTLNELGFENDQISSMKVTADGDTKCTVILYQHGWGGGWSVPIVADNSKQIDAATFMYTIGDLQDLGFINDDMSSMTVRHESSCSVQLYQHSEFSGWSAGPFASGDYTLQHLLSRGFVNDDTSSMRVTVIGNERCIVKLYQHIFWGWEATIEVANTDSETKTFDYNMATLISAGFVNDDMSTMKIEIGN